MRREQAAIGCTRIPMATRGCRAQTTCWAPAGDGNSWLLSWPDLRHADCDQGNKYRRQSADEGTSWLDDLRLTIWKLTVVSIAGTIASTPAEDPEAKVIE
jgi:hypothetical protein